jgi:hypothetical protein
VRRAAALALLAAGLGAASGCDRILPQRADTTLPPIEEVRDVFRAHGVPGEVEYNGNVVEVRVVQPFEQLRRGGSLWARLGPHIYLFSPATREVFDRWAGVAAARVITATSDGEEIGRALLRRDALTIPEWQRSHHLLGIALRDGTERPVEIQRFVDWGERYTEYRYNQRYAPGWGTGERD